VAAGGFVNLGGEELPATAQALQEVIAVDATGGREVGLAAVLH
jgi:hypothetical protein